MAVTTVTLGFVAGLQEFLETVVPAATTDVIKNSAGTLFMLGLDNTANAAITYIRLWDNNGAVVTGTTAPDWIFKIPASKKFTLVLTDSTSGVATGGIAFANGLQIAASTTAGTAGNTAPSSAVVGKVLFS